MYEDSPSVGVDRFLTFCESYPDVYACCAHVGAPETEAFLDVLCDHDTAFHDTFFAQSTRAAQYGEFAPESEPDAVFEKFAGRITYGSDVPNVPYPYRAERGIARAGPLRSGDRRTVPRRGGPLPRPGRELSRGTITAE